MPHTQQNCHRMKVIAIGWAVLVVIGLCSAQIGFSQQQQEDQQQPAADAFMQYEALKKDPWGPAALNFFLGFGIGSFVQGETTTGLILVGGNVIGIGLVVVGAVSAVAAAEDLGVEVEDLEAEDLEGAAILTLAGVGILVASGIYGAIAPFIHANSFNEKLRRDLGISITEISLVVPGGQRDGFGVRVTLEVEV